MTTYHFKAQALTPIHIGCGCEIEPTEFLIKDEKLVQFNAARVIENLPSKEKERFIAFTDRADLKEIQNFLRHHLDVERHGISTIDTAAGFRSEYAVKASNPNNQFRVDMMPRNPHTGQVYIPGSSIKGAIRTAVVDYFTNLNPETRPVVHEHVKNERFDNKKGQALEEKALNCLKKDTHRDIFRLIHVRDAVLPDCSTRIDRAANSGAKGIQMWVERIKSKVDQANSPEFTVSIRMDTIAMKHPSIKNNLGRTININTLFDACNRFYWGRMVAEGNRFDERASDGASWKSIEKTFPLGQLEDGRVLSINPSVSFWNDPEYLNRRMLLRVGHFSHFESLSVDELRRGWNARKKEPITDMGSTRTRCVMEKGKDAMPFGWLMLTLDQEKDVKTY
jgi:CRISPR-associated protein Csm5